MLVAVPPFDIVVPLNGRVPGPHLPSKTAPGRWFDPLATGAIPVGKLLDLFQVSVLHNIVPLLFGVTVLVAARAARTARACLIVGGSSIWCCEPKVDCRSDERRPIWSR